MPPSLVPLLCAHILPPGWSTETNWAVTGLALLAAALAIGYYWRQLRRQRRELRRSEARFRRFFEEATVAIIEEDFSMLQ